jgi:hypothetical protein
MNSAVLWGTPFQRIALVCLAVALTYEILGMAYGKTRKGLAALRILVWLVSALTIAQPQIVQAVASWIGIRRGADLLVYLLTLVFVAAAFFFYSRYLRLEQQVIMLVRELAILQARRQPDVGSGLGNVPSSRPSSP